MMGKISGLLTGKVGRRILSASTYMKWKAGISSLALDQEIAEYLKEESVKVSQ